MDLENVVRFVQPNLPQTSFVTFEEMRMKGVLCDLILKVQNHSFKVHRLVLAAGIPYFQSLYANGEAKSAVEEIPLDGLDPKTLESLIQFSYTSTVNISFENVYSLIHASNFLQLNQVFNACVQFLLKRLSNHNVVRIHELAHKFEIKILTQHTNEYMRRNFEKIFKQDEFLNLPHACIKEVISVDDLNVSSEETVFEAVVKWVDTSSSERHQILPELLGEVRMVFLHTDYLVNQVTSNELVRTSRPCTDLLEEVKNYHLLSKGRASFPQLKTQPRKFYCSSGGIYTIWYSQTTGYSVYHCDLERGRISHNLASLEGPHGSVYGVTAVNEKIYVFHEKTVQTFHVRTHQWETLVPRHDSMKGAAIASHGNVIFCFGSEVANLSNKIRCFDTIENRWLRTETMIAGRFNCAAASVEDSFYVTGGFWNYLMPTYMYLIGYSGGNDVEKYNPNQRKCTRVAPMLTPRENHSCSSVNGKVYVCGGAIASGFTNSAEVYDPPTDKWNFISPMPSARSSLSMVSHSGKIYALQGERRNVSFEIYDPQGDKWDPGSPLHVECCLECRLQLACCVNMSDSHKPDGLSTEQKDSSTGG